MPEHTHTRLQTDGHTHTKINCSVSPRIFTCMCIVHWFVVQFGCVIDTVRAVLISYSYFSVMHYWPWCHRMIARMPVNQSPMMIG